MGKCINGDVLSDIFISSFGGVKFNHIIADPPWRYNDRRKIRKDGKSSRFGIGAQNHYCCIATDDLCKLPIQELSDDRCHLYLWVTCPMLLDGIQVLQAWGFSFSTVIFVWVKCNSGMYSKFAGDILQPSLLDGYTKPVSSVLSSLAFFGPGFYTGSNVELVLLGTKVKPFKHNEGVKASQVIFSPIMEHSRKPDDVHNRIDAMYPEGNRLELFARRKPPREWWAFGNEV